MSVTQSTVYRQPLSIDIVLSINVQRGERSDMKHKLEYGFIVVMVTLVVALTGLELGQEVGDLLSSVSSRLARISPHS
jgi:dihydroneopterin aldolase